jgi:hypothetical protein
LAVIVAFESRSPATINRWINEENGRLDQTLTPTGLRNSSRVRERAWFSSGFISALLRDFRQAGPAAIAKARLRRRHRPQSLLRADWRRRSCSGLTSGEQQEKLRILSG